MQPSPVPEISHGAVLRFVGEAVHPASSFHHKCHPREMEPTEVRAFLLHLAVHRTVSASTQINRSMLLS
jgi:hypothetical protein